MCAAGWFEDGAMTFGEYAKRAAKFAVYPHAGQQHTMSRVYATLGLTGEAGEVAEKVKKFIRDNVPEPHYKVDVLLELGDALWYLTRVANEHGWTLEEVAAANIKKLEDRKQRGTLHGEGDGR